MFKEELFFNQMTDLSPRYVQKGFFKMNYPFEPQIQRECLSHFQEIHFWGLGSQFPYG